MQAAKEMKNNKAYFPVDFLDVSMKQLI